MKNVLKFIFTIVAISGHALNSPAQANDVSGVSVKIITPITIVKNVDMSFGNLAISASSPGTAILSPSGTRTTGGGGGVTLPATTGTVSAASFTISGQANYTYAITLPIVCTINDGSGNTMTGNTFTSNPSTSGILSTSGTQVLSVGATLSLIAGQVPGSYSNATGLPVTVNYN